MSSTEPPVSGAPGRRRKPADSPAGERPGPNRGPRRRRGGRRGGKRGPLVPILVGVLGVAVVALAVVLVIEFVNADGATAGPVMPNRYAIYEAGEANEVLGEREADPRPFNENEVFDDAGITSGDLSFALEAKSITDDNCAEAVWGPKTLAALESAECSQVVRGGYVSEDYISVAAIFKLRDTEGARTLAEGLAPPESETETEGGFLLPPSTEAPFNALGSGFSSATATVNGHYLVVLWVQSKDSTSVEEVENLESPLVALSRFDMAIYHRITERTTFLDNTGGGTNSDIEGTGVEGTGTEGTSTEGAG